MILKDDGKIMLTKEEEELVSVVLIGEELQFRIPGPVPYWLADNPVRRKQLAKKLRGLAASCSKKKWPFEEKT